MKKKGKKERRERYNLKHAERRKEIDVLARELSPYITLSGDHLESVKKSMQAKLYARGLSETAVRSWWRAIEARARVLTKPIERDGGELIG